MNASFDDRPARFTLASEHIVLIDPLVLDGLAAELVEVGAAAASDQPSMLRALGDRGLRIGLHQVSSFRPGEYEVDPDSFLPVDDARTTAAAFEVDSGAVVLIDLSLLGRVAQTLTWERYDELLRSPIDDDSLLIALNADVGGAGFAIVSADAHRSFDGDGAFRLKPDQPTRVSETSPVTDG